MNRQSSGTLNVSISGAGPTVVLLHGYLSSLHYWDNLRSQLQKQNKVIAIDLLGFGDSPKPSALRYGYDDHVGWIKRALVESGIDGPFILVGHSMGALIALRYASQFKEDVRRLALLNMPIFKNTAEARAELAGTNLAYRAGLYWGLHRLIWPVMRSVAGRVVMRKVLPISYGGMSTYMFSNSALSRSGSLHNVIERQDIAADISRLAIPATLVVGKNDRQIYRQNLSMLSELQNLEVVLADTGHHTPLENPELSLGICSG